MFRLWLRRWAVERRLWLRRRRLRRRYLRYRRQVARYDCGSMLLDTMRPDLARLRAQIEAEAKAIEKVDWARSGR